MFQENLYSDDGQNRPLLTYADLIKNNWNCLHCGAQWQLRQVDCINCKVFRPLETYQNILQRPEKVTTAEINALENRRKQEKQIILDLEYKAAGDSEEEEAKQERWYIISSEWLFKWKCFV